MAHDKLSQTAAFIAVKFYGLTLNPQIGKNFDSSITDFYEKVVQFLPKHLSWYHNTLRFAFWRKFFIASEELLLPGDLMHIICRKYYVTQCVDEAIKNGCEQIVIIGAGLDHLGVYSASKGLEAFEIETFFMAQTKNQFLKVNNLSSNNLHFCPLDVTKKRMSQVLAEHPKFDSSKQTAFVAEGFFDYLTETDARNVCSEIATLCPSNTLITTFFSLDELNVFHRFSFKSGVRLVGESVKLSLNKKSFLSLLDDFEYKTEKVLSYQEMKSDLVESSGLELPVLKGFYVIKASVKKDRKHSTCS